MDEWDLLEEVDVIALWPKEHQNNLISSKWQERREALEALVHLIEKNPRLSTASMTIYGEVMDSLKKIIAHDSNVNVVASALRVLTRLARGLRKRFSCYVPMLLPSMLEKAKEKKSVVQDALNEALDAVSDSCDAERIAKDLCEHLLKPNPQSKQCLCLFLFRYFVRQSGLSTDFVKAVLPIVVKLSSDSNPSVREAACHSLGSARRVLGKSLDAFLIPISSEKAKLEKVEESCSEAKKQHEEFISQRPQSKSSEIYESGDHNEAVDSGAIISSNGLKDDDPWILMTPTDIIVQIRKDFDEMLASKKWQDRKEALDNMLSIVECSPRIATSPELQNIMAMLLKVLDKDINVNVASTCAKVLSQLAVSMRTDFGEIVPKIMPIVFDKLKDKKAVIRNELVRLCDAAATTAPIECYGDAVCDGLNKSNPQSRSQTAYFVSRLLSRHNTSTIPIEAVKQITPSLLKCSSDSDGDVREAAFRALAAILRCVGMAAGQRLFGELTEDKVKMAKVVEYYEKMQEEYGNRAAPEILRLYASAVKKSTKPSKDLTTSTKSTSTLRATKNLPSVGSARSRPSTTSAQLSQNTGIGIRSSKQTVNPRGVNMTSTSFSRTSHVHPMNDVKRTQQQTQSQTAPVKRAPTVSARISRGSVKPVLVPNIVRVTKHPTKENCNVSGGNLKARSSSNLTNDSTTIVQNTSGLRPPTAVTRISTGIPRLSRPNSPAK